MDLPTVTAGTAGKRCASRYPHTSIQKPVFPQMSGRSGHRFILREEMGVCIGGLGCWISFGFLCLSPTRCARNGTPLRGLMAVSCATALPQPASHLHR